MQAQACGLELRGFNMASCSAQCRALLEHASRLPHDRLHAARQLRPPCRAAGCQRYELLCAKGMSCMPEGWAGQRLPPCRAAAYSRAGACGRRSGCQPRRRCAPLVRRACCGRGSGARQAAASAWQAWSRSMHEPAAGAPVGIDTEQQKRSALLLVQAEAVRHGSHAALAAAAQAAKLGTCEHAW